ncbi:MAG: SpoVR family protein [Pirellulaceae bacterium]
MPCVDGHCGNSRHAPTRRQHLESTYNDLWRTVPRDASHSQDERSSEQIDNEAEAASLELPEENLLTFLANHAPKLKDWQREILRIVRTIAAILLSAATNEDDERRLRDLHAL